jgi:flagellar biosynthetic protein FliQ
MEYPELMEVSRQALWLLIKLSAPVLLVALVVGVIISLIQALTQIQENTLSFVPKMLAVFLCILFTSQWMLSHLTVFSQELSDRIVAIR